MSPDSTEYVLLRNNQYKVIEYIRQRQNGIEGTSQILKIRPTKECSLDQKSEYVMKQIKFSDLSKLTNEIRILEKLKKCYNIIQMMDS